MALEGAQELAGDEGLETVADAEDEAAPLDMLVEDRAQSLAQPQAEDAAGA